VLIGFAAADCRERLLSPSAMAAGRLKNREGNLRSVSSALLAYDAACDEVHESQALVLAVYFLVATLDSERAT
jgi:hypothetical protein